ncbi:hypothetical protein OG320_08970 [Microbispora sp. NBC_01189]|uniref:hypothetical protein n=1 Tax=Microbispora sp. NBC_01189 TaxID=2903583 RepID=UPI002E0FEC11|nr:hypothetical protein OG320_08970 [Microbispora sp. NBC_01189]
MGASNRTSMSIAGTLAVTGLTPLVWGSTYAVTTEFLPPDRPLFTALARAPGSGCSPSPACCRAVNGSGGPRRSAC